MTGAALTIERGQSHGVQQPAHAVFSPAGVDRLSHWVFVRRWRR